jgi:hypothetical protein
MMVAVHKCMTNARTKQCAPTIAVIPTKQVLYNVDMALKSALGIFQNAKHINVPMELNFVQMAGAKHNVQLKYPALLDI